MRRKWKTMSLLMILMVSITACGQTAENTNTSVVTESESIGGMTEVEITPLPESAEDTTIVETPAPTAIPEPTATPAPEYGAQFLSGCCSAFLPRSFASENLVLPPAMRP